MISFLLIFLGSCCSTSYAQLDTPFILPFKAEQFFVTSPNDQNYGSENEPIADANALPTCSSTGMSDHFTSRYSLDEGKTSPNGKWKNEYSGYGSTGVGPAGPTNNAFWLIPKAVTSASQTLAALVKSTGSYCNFIADFDINTVKQLRQGSQPNSWEAGWFIFRYTDMFHYYWFLIRSDGIELGKKDCNTCTNPVDGQKYLVTKNFPTLQPNTWHHWKIQAIGNHIKIWVDNKWIVDYIDRGMTPQLAGGNVAMYTEDAYVKFDHMNVKKIG
jgi:hypothetical protein